MTPSNSPEVCNDADLTTTTGNPDIKHSDSSSVLKSWLAILSVSIGAFALVTSEFLPVGILNEVSADLGISTGRAGLMITLPGIVAALAAPLLTVGVGNLDRRKLLIFLTLMMIIANTIVAFSDSFTAVLVGRLLLGVGIGGFWATAIALSARLAPKGVDVAKSTSIIMAGVTLATVLGVPLGTWLSSHFGWRTTFAITSILGIVVLIIQMVMLPSLKPTQTIKMRDLPALFFNAKARIGLIAVLFIGLAHFAAFTYVAPFFKQISGFNGTIISSLLLLYGAAGVIGNLFAGFAAGKNVRYTFLFIALLIATSVVLFPFLATHLYGAVILISMWGFAFGAFPTCANIWMFISAPEAVERGMPLFVGLFQVIIAAGSFFGGQIVDSFGIPSVLWLATISCIIGGAIVLLLGKGVGSATAPIGKIAAH
jgi:predicted MFS family arabinose efflux permease